MCRCVGVCVCGLSECTGVYCLCSRRYWDVSERTLYEIRLCF